MINVFIFSQNVILESLKVIEIYIKENDRNVFITTHMPFKNEKEYLKNLYPNCEFITFADLMSDKDNERCDYCAYDREKDDVAKYFREIKKMKNEMVLHKVNERFSKYQGYLLADDLGIDAVVFKKAGYVSLQARYYYEWPTLTRKQKIKKALLRNSLVERMYSRRVERIRKKENITSEIFKAFDKEGRKYIFFGNTSRVAYRMELDWKSAPEEYKKLNEGIFETADKCQYLSSLHENWKCPVPDDSRYDVRYIQDGYLPPNYSSKYLLFKPNNVRYYAWDVLGEETFQLFNIPVSVMPFRKKMYLPQPYFREKVRVVLVAASGPGDWTAQKNRSDEDIMVEAFIEIAKRKPDIKIIYRCHPTWVHPEHKGVNSISRVERYIQEVGLKNFEISGNIPKENLNNFQLSFPRSSFQEDLKKADIVFGEHSVSMIDAGLEKIPFASVNLTNRRNLFCGITNMGFPHCKSVDEIEQVIDGYSDQKFQSKYSQAVKEYNVMTDKTDE